jgi:moderate conductance mechanosensitive channel
MVTETITTLVLLSFGAIVCLILHLLIGAGQHRLAHRYGSQIPPGVDAIPSLKALLVEWLGHALRTSVWVLYSAIVLAFLPRTRSQVETVGTRFRRQALHFFDWLFDRGFNIFIVIVVTIFIMRFTDALIRTIFVLMKRTAAADEAATQRRLQTLSLIFSRVAQSVVLFIGLMTLLQQLNVNVTPILASAGVVGIAVGFGAQSLIRDLFSGFLILLEDQFSVGDVVKIAEFSGTVENVSLRATRIRGLDGSLTTIPNGSITTVSNLSKDWSRVVLDLEIDYVEDVDRAMRLALDTAIAYRQELPHEMIEDPAMLGVDRISLSTVTIRIVVKTDPARQFDLARELRRRIKNVFQANGIKTPITNPQLILSEPVRPAVEQAAPPVE